MALSVLAQLNLDVVFRREFQYGNSCRALYVTFRHLRVPMESIDKWWCRLVSWRTEDWCMRWYCIHKMRVFCLWCRFEDDNDDEGWTWNRTYSLKHSIGNHTRVTWIVVVMKDTWCHSTSKSARAKSRLTLARWKLIHYSISPQQGRYLNTARMNVIEAQHQLKSEKPALYHIGFG